MCSNMSTDGLTVSVSAKSTKAATAQASVQKLLEAAVHVIRSKGYSAARVEDICAEAASVAECLHGATSARVFSGSRSGANLDRAPTLVPPR